MRAASGDVTAWKHGVWLALCADVSLRDPVQIVARALGVNASSPSMLRAELCDHLRPRELLLVLDNAECCSDAADLIKVLLYSAPELKIIATSLECIGVRGEMVIRVDGLHYPDAPPAADVTLDAWLEQYPAVALFGANATRAKPGWTLTREDAPHVAHICQLVEGNPLALELAGAWARWLSCEQIAAKMNTSFDFLSRAHADLAPRCTTLRGAFEYAWTRLSLAQQSQMKKLAGLDCAFTADTAQRGAGVSLDELAVLGDKSMLRPLADSRFEIYALHMPYLREKLPRAGHALSAGEGASAFVRAPVVAAGAGVAV
jgi:non-specific serine/threonine protein kinase